ncbi:hypothetical protein AB0C76_16625 [Kitasatospora sp. NPDC048722]|uniref:hypothetical protein n=1 Tax=Kitasatospora sp. NPDC048722 TaxID=3155639 RepID=UPI0034029559
MNPTRTRRTLGAGAATLVAALSVGTAAVPAHAADHQLKVFPASGSLQIPSQPVAPPRSGENVFLRIGRTGTGAVSDVKLALDVSGLDGLATLEAPGCTTAGKVITCTVGRLDQDNINITTNLWLSAVPGAKPGSSGTVRATLSAPGAETGTADFRVDVGTATFRTHKPTSKGDAKVGSKLPSDLEFANHGELPAKRAIVHADLSAGLTVDTWPSNCEYAVDKGQSWGKDAPMPTVHGICTIDGEIAPGQAVKLNGLDITVGPDAYYTTVDYGVFATADAYGTGWLDDLRKRLTFKPGTGAPATLAKSAGDGIPAGNDTNGYSTEQEVLADNSADFQVAGGWAPDASGAAGTLTTGMSDNGPASIYDRSGGEGAPNVVVQLPEGVTVTSLPPTCVANDYVRGKKSDKPLNKFACDGVGTSFMPAGASITHKLGLRLPAGTGELVATVSLQNEQSSYEDGHPSAVMPWDRNPANDLLKVTLRPAAPAGGGTGTPVSDRTTAAAPEPATGATATPSAAANAAAGGALADTGSSATLPLAGASAAAVALGTAALIGSRRLRARRNG